MMGRGSGLKAARRKQCPDAPDRDHRKFRHGAKGKNVKMKHWIITAALAGAPVLQLAADETSDTIKSLKAQVEALDQKLKILERKQELASEEAGAWLKDLPKISLGQDGFSFGSGDGNFSLRLRGVLQLDSRTFFSDGGIKGKDGFLIRRARPIIQGTVWRDFDFLFVPDFGGTTPQIADAYLNYRIRPEFQLQAGKFKSPVGLESLQSDVEGQFNERGLPTSLVPSRDLGIQLHGEIFDGRFSYAAAILNGVGDARTSTNLDFDDDKEFAGRVFFQPFKKSSVSALDGLGFGLGGTYGKSFSASALPSTTGGTFPGYATDGQEQFFAYNPTGGAVVVANGEHWRLSPQGYYYHGPFGFLGEYVISDQRVSRTVAAPLISRRLENTAWQVSASWVLTGEPASYKGVVPDHPFDLSAGGWGAWQVVARFGQLEIDRAAFPLFSDPKSSAYSAQAWSVGLDWWLNKNVRVSTSFSHTEFGGGGGAGAGSPAAVTRQDENVFFTRMQLAF